LWLVNYKIALQQEESPPELPILETLSRRPAIALPQAATWPTFSF
jgi:hypothetical protein